MKYKIPILRAAVIWCW